MEAYQLAAMIHSRSAIDTATVVISGLVIVLFVLVVLIFVFKIFGAIVHRDSKKEAPKAPPAPKTVPKEQKRLASKVKTRAAEDASADGAVIAAITAAIEASEGKSVRIRSVRVKDAGTRNPWAAAAVSHNTMPF